MKIKKIQDLSLRNKKVIIRVDFNVPIKNAQVQDKTRLSESLETFKYLLNQNCSIVIISHLGRPEGKFKSDLSLKILIKPLQKLLKQKIFFASDCVGEIATKASKNLKPKEILLLENLRFHPEEEKNDLNFAKKLAQHADIYINDAFGTAHRAHSSTVAITKYLPSAAGFLMQKEITNLSRVLENNSHPFTLIVGGAKMDTKIDLIKNFASRADYIVLGGGIANTFLASQSVKIGQSLHEKSKIKTALETTSLIKKKRTNLILPKDFIASKKASKWALSKVYLSNKLPDNYAIYDLGPKSVKNIEEIILRSKLIVWNGPVGLFEIKKFSKGSQTIAKAIIKATGKNSYSVIGGGDTLEALKRFKLKQNKFSHISTGGGAMLEYLEKGTLPGIECLKD